MSVCVSELKCGSAGGRGVGVGGGGGGVGAGEEKKEGGS